MRSRVLSLLAVVLCASFVLAANDPMMGTWKLNVTQSQLGDRAPRSIIRKHVPIPGGVKVIQDRVDAEGKASTGEFTVMFDGKDYSISGDPFVDRLTMTRVDPYMVDGVGKKNDKIATRFSWKVSKDGRTMVYSTDHLYPPERVGKIVQVLEKQQ